MTGAWTSLAEAGADWSAPFAQYGLAGLLVAFVLWLFVDERKERRALQAKVLADILPALLANNEELRESTQSTRDAALAMERMTTMAHQLASRPNIDPVLFSEWSRTLNDLRRKLDQ